MLKIKSKSGMSAIEIAIGTTMAVVAIFIAIGLFNDNLSGMITSGSLSNFFTENNAKSEYSAMNRDYSDSQINVQITGEQGLQMLRKDANNKVLSLISSDQETQENANEIGYLALVIEGIVGQPDICVYMNKESDKFCNEDDIGGYSYKVDSNSASTIILKKVDITGTIVEDTIQLNLDDTVSSLLGSAKSQIEKDNNGRSKFNEEEKLTFVDDLADNIEPHIRKNVILRRHHHNRNRNRHHNRNHNH